jgi:hypothetical protein
MDSLENDLDSAYNSISSAGTPAVIAGVENYASQQLAQQASANQTQAQAAVAAATKNGGASTGVMASIQSMFGSIAQGTVFNQYGLYIIGGLIVIILVARKV